MATVTQDQLVALRQLFANAQAQLGSMQMSMSNAMMALDALITQAAPPPAPPPIVTPPPAPPPVVVPPPAPPPSGALPTLSMPQFVDVDPSATMAFVPLTLSSAPQTQASVALLTRNASAIQDRDFRRFESTITFQAGGPATQKVGVTLMPNGGVVGKSFDLYATQQDNPGITSGGQHTTTIRFVAGATSPPPSPPPVVTPPPPASPPPVTGLPAGTGALVWQFDPAQFKASDGGGPNEFRTRFAYTRDQAGNGELGLYADPVLYPGTKPYEIRNGVLVLRAEKYKTPITYNNKQFGYGACVLTANFLSQLYGYYECECQSASARGTWGAFWMLPSDNSWPPEIDIFEHPRNGTITNSFTTATNHWLDGNNVHQMVYVGNLDLRGVAGFPSNIDLTTGYHKYGLSWRADWTIWYIDGIQIFKTQTTFKKPAYPLWDIAVGGWGGTPDFSTGTTEMLIRSAKVYK